MGKIFNCFISEIGRQHKIVIYGINLPGNPYGATGICTLIGFWWSLMSLRFLVTWRQNISTSFDFKYFWYSAETTWKRIYNDFRKPYQPLLEMMILYCSFRKQKSQNTQVLSPLLILCHTSYVSYNFWSHESIYIRYDDFGQTNWLEFKNSPKYSITGK